MTNTLNFGLAEALHAIRESKSYSNNQLRYSVDTITKNYSAGYKEHHLVEGFLQMMESYTWDESLAAIVKPVMESFNKQADRLGALHLYEALSAYDRMGFMKDATNSLIDFVNERKTSVEVVAALGKFSYDGRIKSFCNTLMLKENKNMDIQRSTSTCDVSDVYSPVFESGDTTFFSADNTYFSKDSKGLHMLKKSEVQALPEKFKAAVELFNGKDVKIVEGTIVYRVGRDKYEFVVEGKSVVASLNGKSISVDTVEHLAEFSASSSFDGNSGKRTREIDTIRSWATRVVKVEDVKVLTSKVYEGLSTTVFNVNDQLYVHCMNEGMGSDEFGKMSATAAIKKIRKDLRFDISKSFAYMLVGESKRISDLNAVSVKINENIAMLQNKISSVTNINESAEVDNAIQALKDALNKERAQYNQVNREIAEIEVAMVEEDSMDMEMENPAELDHAEQDAIKVGDLVKTSEGKTGKVTGFSEEGGEATVILDGGEVIHPMVADLKKVGDELDSAIAMNNTMEESGNMDHEEELSAMVAPEDVVGATELVVTAGGDEPEMHVEEPEMHMDNMHTGDAKACLVISFGPYHATSMVDIDAAEFESKHDNENVTIKNPVDGIDLIPKKYLKVEATIDVNTPTILPEPTVEVDEAKREFSEAHPELGGKIDMKINTMGRVEGTHKMTDFLEFLDKHVGDKKITDKTRYAGDEEHEIYGDPKFFVLVDGEIEEGFVDERDAENMVSQLKVMRGNSGGNITVVERGKLDSQDLNDYLATINHVEESENHVDNSDMTLHHVMTMVMGEDHGITEEEILSQFTKDEVQEMNDFIRNHQDLIKKLDGIPYDGESEEWDQISEPGKKLLGDLLDAYDEAGHEEHDEHEAEHDEHEAKHDEHEAEHKKHDAERDEHEAEHDEHEAEHE